MSDAKGTVDAVEPTTEALGGVEGAKRSMLGTIERGAALVAKGFGVATPLIAVLRKLDPDDGLAWLGLSRRRSPLVDIGIFGAGVAMGATVALIFAPMSGAELRRRLSSRRAPVDASPTEDAEAEAASPASSTTPAKKARSARHPVRTGVVPSNHEPTKAS